MASFYDQNYLPAAQNVTGLPIGRSPMPIAVAVQQAVETEAEVEADAEVEAETETETEAEPRTAVRLHTFGRLDTPIWFLLH